MYFVKTPEIFKVLCRKRIWSIKNSGRKIFITFDDGPEPEVTPAIMDILKQYNAKATFFCLGIKILKNQNLLKEIRENGHTIGNHSFHHVPGNKTTVSEFIREVEKCNALVSSKFYRPPYGKISSRQAKAINKQYHIILWDVLPGDFDPGISKEKCLARSVKNTKDGTIIVFHDSLKSKEKVLYTLPRYLEHFSKLGYTFEALKEEYFQKK
jgi:peptidoglycan/xylan/chitin deacetylase (PgdA/CDA1 family)